MKKKFLFYESGFWHNIFFKPLKNKNLRKVRVDAGLQDINKFLTTRESF